MDLYKEKDERLKDSEPIITFIKRVNKVIMAMTSRSPIGALKSDNGSSKICDAFIQFRSENKNRKTIFVYNFPIQVISDFQEYLEEWHDKALENDWKFLSSGT